MSTWIRLNSFILFWFFCCWSSGLFVFVSLGLVTTHQMAKKEPNLGTDQRHRRIFFCQSQPYFSQQNIFFRSAQHCLPLLFWAVAYGNILYAILLLLLSVSRTHNSSRRIGHNYIVILHTIEYSTHIVVVVVVVCRAHNINRFVWNLILDWCVVVCQYV